MGPTYALIDHTHLAYNLDIVRKLVAPARIMAVVKADAYGHGLIEVSRTLIQNGVEYLGVAFPEEGIQLREAGIRTPILVMGMQLSNFFEDHLEYDLDITLGSREQLEPLRALCKLRNQKARVQIKVDTGMGRVGFFPEKDIPIIEEIINDPAWYVVGIYSHLSSADEQDPGFTLEQIERFRRLREKILNKTKQRFIFHLANSAALQCFSESHFDMVRPGIMLYGSTSSPNFTPRQPLKQVMTLKSRLVLIRKLGAGIPVGYNRRYVTPTETHIGVISIGYADGYDRRFTNKGEVLIRGKRYPVVGSVCMDQIMVDLGKECDLRPGEEVVLIGRQGEENLSLSELAAKIDTIPYVISCGISKRVSRKHRLQ